MKNLLLIIFFFTSCSVLSSKIKITPAEKDKLRVMLETGRNNSNSRFVADNKEQLINSALKSFYQRHQYQPIWISGNSISDKAKELILYIEKIDQEGLNSEDYFSRELKTKLEDPSNWQAEIEFALSRSALSIFLDGSMGRAHVRKADGEEPLLWDDRSKNHNNLLSQLNAILVSEDPVSEIDKNLPQGQQYKKLKQAVHKYQLLSKESYQFIPSGNSLRIGDKDYRIQLIKQNLALLGDLNSDALINDEYDMSLTEALRKFKKRHGLEQNQLIDASTLLELNITPASRLKTLIINLERWRWIPEQQESSRQIWVNIPGFELFVPNFNNPVFQTKIIVGKPQFKTPLFSSYINNVEINPAWNVPRSILKNEILPKINKDPEYLIKEHLRFIGENNNQLRQDPGPWNALGQLKLNFLNKYDVYLHDTPAKILFNREFRAFSHGCIRVENVNQLAALLLNEQDDLWSSEKIYKLILSNKNIVLRPKNQFKLIIEYRTAWVADDESLNFRKDLYHRDSRIKKVLF